MANIIYTHPEDNVAPDASWAIASGLGDGAYPVANLTDGIYAKPAKAASGTAITFEANFGSPDQSIEIVAFGGQHNLAGASVKVDNDQGMTQQTLVIPANRADGQSVCPWLDLSGVANHAGSIWTFTITGAAAPPAVGEIALYTTKRSLPDNPLYGFSDEEVHGLIEHATDYGWVKPPYDLGFTTRTLTGLEVLGTVANIATIRDWHRACYGRVKSCLIVLDPAVNDARFVRFVESKWVHVLRYPDLHTTSFSLEEVARGPVL